MAKVPEFNDDLRIIEKLGINPGPENGLNPDELKRKFDEAVLIIQNFINTELIPFCNNYVAPDTEGFLNKTGGSMNGDISMGSKNRVTNMADPENAADAATKGWIERTLKKYVTTQGNTTVEGQISVPNPLSDRAVVPMGYMKDTIKKRWAEKAAVLRSDNWHDSVQSVECPNLTTSAKVIVSADGADLNSVNAWSKSKIWAAEQGNGSLKFKFYGRAPETDCKVIIFYEVEI